MSARARYCKTAIWDDVTRRADVGARLDLDSRNVPNEERPTHLASKEQRKRDEAAGLLEHPRRRRHR